MQERSIVERVEILERKVEALEDLPARVTAVERQIVLLRTEMREGFSAIRTEMRGGDDETRRSLREEIRGGDDETRRYMRVLHEEVLERIALIGDHRRRKR